MAMGAEDDIHSGSARPSRPTSVMVLALVMLVSGFLGLFRSLNPEMPGRLQGTSFAFALFTMLAGVLLMGPKIGWYLGMIDAGLNLVQAMVLSIWVIGYTRTAPDVSGLVVLAILPGLFVAVLTIMILLNPAARASYGIGARSKSGP